MKRVIKDISKYSNKWIAVDRDNSTVVSSSSTYQDLLLKISKIKKDIFLMKLPSVTGSLTP